jgi:hypothetical protein
MILPTIEPLPTGGPCIVCTAPCYALVDGRRVHVLTCWPMLTEEPTA